MNDFLCWLYDHYIHPHILAQPMDDGDTFRCCWTAASRRSSGGMWRRCRGATPARDSS